MQQLDGINSILPALLNVSEQAIVELEHIKTIASAEDYEIA